MKNLLLLLLSIIFFTSANAQVVINPCAQATDIHVVVIGSSTAAGSGPSNSANAWVNRYRTYLQSINPNNLVTNLAIGGTRTYHIMPDWFVSPTNRPSPNPSNNVSEAIRLGADAIIVNMPSNDGASGYSVGEQMFNFHTIVNVADSAGVPVWVCTTQPRNGLSAAQIVVQTQVRDSILLDFGSRAIDFWNPFGTTGNTLASQWDSGDGVHMNDTAHAVLNSRVVDEGIPNEVTDTLSYTDHVISDIYLSNVTECGNLNTGLHVVLTNLGLSSTSSQNVDVQFQDIVTSNTGILGSITLNPLGACVQDTLNFTINSYSGLNRNYQAFINASTDVDISNDTSAIIHLVTNGHPSISGINDTVFAGANALLSANTGVNDSIVWYDAMTGGNILAYGNQYTINNVQANQTVYPEAVREALQFSGSVFTTVNTTTDWNGMMFDIVAQSNIIIDSLQVKINTTGTQTIEGYNRIGSRLGNEMNQAVWNNWGTDVVNAANAGDFETIQFPAVSLQAGDTLGVYIYMQNSAARISYLNSAATVYADNHIAVMNGAGIAHTFGTVYSPRNFSGEVFYHNGSNPNGRCFSDRIPVSAIIKYPNSIENLESIGLKIYPNPSNGIIHFEGEKLPKMVNVKDIQGRTVRKREISFGQINLSDLQGGLYFLNFEIGGKRFVQKVMIE